MNTLWKLAHDRTLHLGPRAVIMGVLNVTPDSFSDGGLHANVDAALAQADAMIRDGAAIIDVGGESTRPNAEPVDAVEEQRRILPVIEALAARQAIVISVDTYREETARLAVKAGAHIVNDVWGLQREPGIAKVAAETGAGLCIMHTGRERARLDDPIEDQRVFLRRSLEIAAKAGIADDHIVLDPGFGFAKETMEDNVVLMVRMRELLELGYPLLIGTSRKRFLGAITGREAADRDVATAATSAILRLAGADIFRVHNVAFNADALAVSDAMLAMKRTPVNPAPRG
ncbi:MAG: dihydropteroate synthase [Rhizobiaceae bacterium]